jgi:hypothetical protein
MEVNRVGGSRQAIVSTTTTVAEKAVDYLSSIDEWVRASTVAEEIDSSTDYTRQVLNDLHGSGRVQKKEDGAIIGTTINDNLWVLDSVEQAKTVIRLYGDLTEKQMGSMTLDELRNYVEEELGDRTGPIQSKVWYRRD